MAKQIGIIKVTGLIDDISYYQSPWGLIARRKGGASKERIKSAPEFENVRKHNSEFAACAKAGAFLRQSLRAFWFEKKVHERAGNVLKLMSDLMKFDTLSVYGERRSGIGLTSIAGKTYIHKKILEGKLVWASVFPKNIEVTRLSGGVRVDLNGLDRLLQYPKDASHLHIKIIYMNFDLDTKSGLVLQERETRVLRDQAFTLTEVFARPSPALVNEAVFVRCEFFRSANAGQVVAVQDARWRYLGVYVVD